MRKVIFLFFILITLFTLVGCQNVDKEKVNQIISSIESLPTVETLSLDDQGEIEGVRELYNSLTDKEKEKIENYDKLVSLEEEILVIMLKEEQLVEGIQALIEELPSKNSIKLTHEKQLSEIEELINSISETSKSYIYNLDHFIKAKEKYDELVYLKQLGEQISQVIDLIDELPNALNMTLEHEEQITKAREAYNQIPDESKNKVENYNKLEEAEGLLQVLKTNKDFDPQEILGCISDVLNDKSNDELITKGTNYTVKWSSLNPEVLSLSDGFTKVNKIYQTHRNQKITVVAEITFDNQETITITKEVTVSPIVFEKLSDTPVATYFQTSALTSYTNHSQRYKEEKTLFSDKAKEALDIVYYAFAHIDAYGGVSLSDINVLEELIKLRENDVRVIMSLAGVSSAASKDFTNVTGNDVLRAKFVKNVMDAVDKYHFDGVDIDWESTSDYKVKPENMNKLAKDLKNEMIKRQAKGGTPYLLTAAIPATSWGAGSDRFDFATLNKYLDYVNMMSYDLNNPDKSTHVSALYSSNYDKGYGFSVQWGVNLFTSRGLDKKKIIIGSAGYGKAYKVNNPNLSSKFPGIGLTATLTQISGMDGSFASGTVFLNVIDSLLATGKYEKYIEYNANNQVVGSYLFNKDENIFVTYESEEVMKAKYEYATSIEGMGIMCWAYTEDTRDTYVNTIYEALNK